MDATKLYLPHLRQRRLSLVISAGIAIAGGCYIIYHLAQKMNAYPPIPEGKQCSLANCVCPKHDPESYWLYQQKLDKLNQSRKEKKKSGKGMGGGFFGDAVYEEKKENIEFKFPVQVFLRIRPLVGQEIEDQHESITFSIKTSKKKGTQSLVLKKSSSLKTTAASNGDNDNDDGDTMSAATQKLNKRLKSRQREVKYQGFKMILTPSDHNMSVFSKCILPSFPSIMRGEKTCAFAYGHTGSGKTHTIYGYPPDRPGMFQLFAGALIDQIFDREGVFVEVRFSEMYQGKIYDLLTQPKSECFLRENSKGSYKIAKAPVFVDGMMREETITRMRVNDLDELLKVIADGINSRKCGLSTLHDKSSRSHAFLEFELVSTELTECRQKLVGLDADILFQNLLMDYLRNKIVDKTVLPSHKQLAASLTKAGKVYRDQVESGKMTDNGALHVVESKMRKAKKEYKQCQERIDEILSDCSDTSKECIGGTMCFVDLAGNEYGRDVKNKDKQEERERIEINKSLLALKECIRSLHNRKSHVGYRNSKLTQYLKGYLDGKGNHAIAINCIGSSKEYTKQSVNTLQYAALMAKI